MGNMTLAIPNELQHKMKEFPEIRWSEIARRAIEEKVNDLETMNKIASKSKLTKRDIDELSKKINKAATKRFLAR